MKPLITSTQNIHVKAVCELKESAVRKERGQCVVEGTRAISAFMQAHSIPIALYATPNTPFPVDWGVVQLVSDQVMKKMSSATTPSGVLGVFPIPEPAQLAAGIVLVDIADPGNMGTLIRTCAALGKETVVVIGGADPWSPKVIQSSAGTIAHVHIHCISWDELRAQKGSVPLCALVVTGGQKPSELDLKNALLVIGSEAHGLSEEQVAQCDLKATLPMPGNTESLNAAIAGSIALYIASKNY